MEFELEKIPDGYSNNAFIIGYSVLYYEPKTKTYFKTKLT